MTYGGGSLSYGLLGFVMTEAPRFLRPVAQPNADVGMAVTFAGVASLAALGGGWDSAQLPTRDTM